MTTPSALIGTTLGTYEIQSLVGSGGMATVYRGIDIHLQRPVAIKVLAANLAGDPDYVDRFRQEARLVANLRHPHIAQVYAFGEHDGAPYMVQELLPGPTLEQRLRDLAARGETMPQPEVHAIITQLASALDAAHAAGVIHRDVKPSNAITNAAGQMVLADFGIARNTTGTARNLTAAGVVMGTPGYIAPEQAISSASLTGACDIYALGVVLFELLSGQLPFEGDTAMAVVLKHLYDPPPTPTSVRPELPAAVDAVVLRALAKEPAARFASAGALAEALVVAWPLPGTTAAPATPAIHSQPTDVLARSSAGAGTLRLPPAINTDPTQPNPAAQPNPSAQAAPAPPSEDVTPADEPPAPSSDAAGQGTLISLSNATFLPFLLLVTVVLAAAAFVTTRDTGGAAVLPSLAPATVTTGAAMVPTQALPATSAAIVPTHALPATSAPLATAAPNTPLPPAEPTPVAAAPSAAAALPSEPFALFRALLVQGEADGQIEGEAKDLYDRAASVETELRNDKREPARNKLRDLQKKLAENAREGKMDAALAEQLLGVTTLIAQEYGLDTGAPGKGKGKDD